MSQADVGMATHVNTHAAVAECIIVRVTCSEAGGAQWLYSAGAALNCKCKLVWQLLRRTAVQYRLLSLLYKRTWEQSARVTKTLHLNWHIASHLGRRKQVFPFPDNWLHSVGPYTGTIADKPPNAGAHHIPNTGYLCHSIWSSQWRGSPRAIGFIFGMGKPDWLGYNLVNAGRWSTQSIGQNTPKWQTHRQPRRHSKCHGNALLHQVAKISQNYIKH